jgi:hypothetical protein
MTSRVLDILSRFLAEHGVDHALKLLHRPYLHAQLSGLDEDITAAGLTRLGECGVEDGLLVLQLGRIDSTFGEGRGAGAEFGRYGTRRDDMGSFTREEGDLALDRLAYRMHVWTWLTY